MASQAITLQADALDVQALENQDLKADSGQEQKESTKNRSSKYLGAVPNLSDKILSTQLVVPSTWPGNGINWPRCWS